MNISNMQLSCRTQSGEAGKQWAQHVPEIQRVLQQIKSDFRAAYKREDPTFGGKQSAVENQTFQSFFKKFFKQSGRVLLHLYFMKESNCIINLHLGSYKKGHSVCVGRGGGATFCHIPGHFPPFVNLSEPVRWSKRR